MSDEHRFVVIMAGGRGTRLWPLSRSNRPKQFLPLLDETSLLQATWKRALRLASADRILIVGNRALHHLYLEQLPELDAANLLLEPEGRNTAPCITWAAFHALRRDAEAVLVVLSADHAIPTETIWLETMRQAASHAYHSHRLVNIGIQTGAADTRFGYMITGRAIVPSDVNPVFEVERFVEKPDVETLAQLIETGQCLRNMGMFSWRADVVLEEVQTYQPEIYQALSTYMKTVGTPRERQALEVAYAACPSISIDHGTLQKTKRLSVVQSTMQRIDVGSFAAFTELWPTDAAGNAVWGRFASQNSTDNIVFAGNQQVALIGVHNMVIIAHGDTVFICPKEHTQEVKDFLDSHKDWY
jgi:mannose-1-phosphate guanylyltransferase